MREVVSIIVPVYNSERYLRECIESVCNMSYQEYELILVNNGSIDTSLDICTEYAKKDKRIRVLDIPNEGVSVARNCGLAEATGKWITFLDSDDCLYPQGIEQMLSEETSEVDVVLSQHTRDFSMEPNGESNLCELNPELLLSCCLRFPMYYKKLFPKYHINTYLNWMSCGKLYRREFLVERNLRYPQGIFTSEDFLFLLHLYAQKPRVVGTNVTLYYYRVNQSSVTHTFQTRVFENYNKIFTYLDTHFSDVCKVEDIDAYVSERMVDCIRRYEVSVGERITGEKLKDLAMRFHQGNNAQRVMRCPVSKVFIGKKNTLYGTYWLLRLKHIYRKIKNENITSQ